MSNPFTAEELFEQVAESLYNEDIANRKALIRNMLMKSKQLNEDIIKINKELVAKNKQLEETDAKIARFREGDYSVLNSFSTKQNKQEPEGAES